MARKNTINQKKEQKSKIEKSDIYNLIAAIGTIATIIFGYKQCNQKESPPLNINSNNTNNSNNVDNSIKNIEQNTIINNNQLFSTVDSKNTFTVNQKFSSIKNILSKNGYIFTNESPRFSINFIPSTHVYEKEGTYKYDSGFLIVDVNKQKIEFYDLKYESSFKYGNSESISNKELNDKIIYLVENNKVEIFNKLKPYLK